MKLGRAVIVIVVLGVPGGFGLSAGCSRQGPPPAQPSEPPPLPPPSGTPIGLLIDDAAELKLTDDQLDKLRSLSDELAGQLAGDDSGLHPDPVPATQREEKGRGLGYRVGGAHGDGTAGGSEVFPDAPGNGDGSRAVMITSDTATQVYRDRAHHVRDAVRRALALLDAGQKVIARRVLSEHGVDLETGELREPGATKLEEPKPGQPLPREPEPTRKPSKRK